MVERETGASYSLAHMRRFSKAAILEANKRHGGGPSPGKVVLDFIHEQMLGPKDKRPLNTETEDILIIVIHGCKNEEFAHAACFVRKDYCSTKQLLLLDCKNKTHLVYPKRFPVQHAYDDTVNFKEDIEGGYYQWDIYSLTRRDLEGDSDDDIKLNLLHNKMMAMLSG